MCTHIHTRVTHLHLYYSIYVENHEFKLIPSIPIQHLRVPSSFFSFHICNPFSHSARNLPPIVPKVFICLINPLVCHQPLIFVATSPLLTTPPPQPGGPPCSAYQRVFSGKKKQTCSFDAVFPRCPLSRSLTLSGETCGVVSWLFPCWVTRTWISHVIAPSLSFPVSERLTDGC